jgi:hypothetical protein
MDWKSDLCGGHLYQKNEKNLKVFIINDVSEKGY